MEQKVTLFLQLCYVSKSGVLECVVAPPSSPKPLLDDSVVSLGRYGWVISSQPRHSDLTQGGVLRYEDVSLTIFRCIILIAKCNFLKNQ